MYLISVRKKAIPLVNMKHMFGTYAKHTYVCVYIFLKVGLTYVCIPCMVIIHEYIAYIRVCI